MPHPSSAEIVIQAAKELTLALQNPAPAAPFSNIGQEQFEAIHQIETVFTSIHDPKRKMNIPPAAENNHTTTAQYPVLPRVLYRARNKNKKCVKKS